LFGILAGNRRGPRSPCRPSPEVRLRNRGTCCRRQNDGNGERGEWPDGHKIGLLKFRLVTSRRGRKKEGGLLVRAFNPDCRRDQIPSRFCGSYTFTLAYATPDSSKYCCAVSNEVRQRSAASPSTTLQTTRANPAWIIATRSGHKGETCNKGSTREHPFGQREWRWSRRARCGNIFLLGPRNAPLHPASAWRSRYIRC
jgi:hypothetical protein